ncbi:3-methyladenine DNA glycosylase [Sulfurimonas autotrophica]|uniref:DNA-3-methyladenine glycosylase III n=1 Tax=Sulfurimonas autotrophica (strain ATCC BAA-671 / DSM 16294 / JCM 11897 / OK10) TaxID=563040 RepID=E0USD3_SULAO|nr:3-methyladenine DNA glycosylase [Sulfurimonas autotrophica]ADN09096.1 DNA-3-methyladenine glycosylase III [Sulfurimonas autotrophica DSM 16294]
MYSNSLEIYNFLQEKSLLQNSPKQWWPNAGTFEVVVGAILTQNTTWKNVEKSLKNLKNYMDLDAFTSLHVKVLKEQIRPSGFYNQKAPRLLALAANIKNEFHDFETFQQEVTREWLLLQKGIGEESADAILCYGCFRNEMVVDSYTKRLLKTFDIEFKSYKQYKEFLQYDLEKAFTCKELNLVYSRFHGMIVEYNKLYKL